MVLKVRKGYELRRAMTETGAHQEFMFQVIDYFINLCIELLKIKQI
jgi:hypothetical protein